MPKIKVRSVLFLLSFSMFFMFQMSRFNINISIVAMTSRHFNSSEPEWDGKAIILGSYFWGSWATELLGNFLLCKFGARKLLALSYSINAVTSFIFPVAYKFNPLCAVAVRCVQGTASGVTWPALGWISVRWVPKSERSRFMSSYHGTAFGSCITNLLGGVIIDAFGWPYVFYGTGIISVLWVLLWLMFAYDSPAEHPRISTEEKEYLEKSIEVTNSSNKKSHKVPWMKIFTSLPFGTACITMFVLMWLMITMAMQMPTYFNSVHSLDIKTNGLLLSIPDICKMIVGIKFPMVMDNLIKRNKISIINARKVSLGISCFIPALLIFFLGFFGNQSTALAATLFILTITVSGAGTSSLFANIVDISPNNAGTLIGICKALTNIPGALSPLLVKYLLSDNQDNWYIVFTITSCLITAAGILFMICASAERQPWDQIVKHPLEEVEESLELMTKKSNLDATKNKS